MSALTNLPSEIKEMVATLLDVSSMLAILKVDKMMLTSSKEIKIILTSFPGEDQDNVLVTRPCTP